MARGRIAIAATNASFAMMCLILMGVATTTGCTTTATIRRVKPAGLQVADLHRILVVPLRDHGPGTQDIDSRILAEKLRRTHFYAEVVELEESSTLSHQQVIELARQHGCDAAVTARLTAQNFLGHDLGGVMIQLGEPEVRVVVECDLLDCRSGLLRARRRAEESYVGELDISADSSELAQRTLKLADACCDQIIAELAITHVEDRLPLATPLWGPGAAEIRRANEQAAEGQWSEAISRWTQVIQTSPSQLAAAYNLGVGYEALGQWSEAQRWYQHAAQQVDSPEIDAALVRLGKLETEATRVRSQLAGRQNVSGAIRR